MNEEDFASDSDSDDVDFCPEKIDKSDSDSIDEKDEAIDAGDQNGENSKKKSKKKKRGKAQTKKDSSYVQDEKIEEKLSSNPDEDKRREDELWAAFLGESEPPTQQKAPSTSTKSEVAVKNHIPKEQKLKPHTQPSIDSSEIFEFAGEEVVVDQQSTAQATPQNSPIAPSQTSGIKRPIAGGGLSSVLNQISKKNKLTVLQKTQIDWDGFKSKEGIQEELKTHNRGKDGFLERRDFLERTDHRQFEIEKNMRHHSRRSHK